MSKVKYRITWPAAASDGRPITLNIEENVMNAAQAGYSSQRAQIISTYEGRCGQQYNLGLRPSAQEPRWEDLRIERLTPLSGGCDCDCARCDIGSHCYSAARDCA